MYLKMKKFVILLCENTFGSIPISIANYLKSEPKSLQRSIKMVRSVNEKRC